jgi:Ca-activated chloride channel family protein
LHRKRKRRGYIRHSRAKPKIGWALAELAALSGITVRTIRLWLQRGALPRPPFMSSATRYERRHLVWLLAIRRLRTTEKSTLAAIRTRLQALSEPELEALATEGQLSDAVASALGIEARSNSSQEPQGVTTLGRDSLGQQVARWARIELALGVELHVRDDVSPATYDLARRIRETCVNR